MGGGDQQHILDYLKRMQAENPGFYYAIQGANENNTGGNIFWADATARMNYTYFGDTVIFDTTYRTNCYRVPFASFTGLNHHGQPVLFGCALILNESETCFPWLFQTWLHAMSSRHPISITTDPDRLIQVAVSQVLPETRLRFIKSGIFTETQEKLAHIYQSHPTFQAEFNKCINETETVDEFESYWASLLERYFLLDNEWLQSIHNARQQWVPVYMRNTFFGELSKGGANKGVSAFFEGHVNSSTTMQTLIKRYEKAIASWHEKELKADYDTSNTLPVLKTPSPTERDAAHVYTRRIFMKFQEEFVETLANPTTKIDESGTLTTYRVAKFGEDNKAHNVSFDFSGIKASCSCQMFEYSGIICRHILAVFRARNVFTLPCQYVLKRWTKNAKSEAALVGEAAAELPNNFRDSLTVRYTNLRQEAVKFVEEGAKSIQIYHVAMAALEEAARKVACVTNQGCGANEEGAVMNGSNPPELRVAENTQMATRYHQSADEKEKRIRELSEELQSINHRCQAYRSNLLTVLRDMEEQKLKLCVKVENARLSLKE